MKDKTPTAQFTADRQTPVFPPTLHHHRPDAGRPPLSPESLKRDNVFSKSRDRREDRGTREMNTAHNTQTLPHGH